MYDGASASAADPGVGRRGRFARGAAGASASSSDSSVLQCEVSVDESEEESEDVPGGGVWMETGACRAET